MTIPVISERLAVFAINKLSAKKERELKEQENQKRQSCKNKKK